MRDRSTQIAPWFKYSYTLLVALLAPVFAYHYGVVNFLWFSNVALFLTLAAIWLRSRLFASMMAVGVVALELGWNVLFLGRLLFGLEVLGLLDYMFDARIPLWARLVSLYHVPLPFVLLWLVWKWGYDGRALAWQTGLAWIVLPLSLLASTPRENVNMVYGLLDAWGEPVLRPPLHLALSMIGFPVLIYWPTHVVFKRYLSRRTDR